MKRGTLKLAELSWRILTRQSNRSNRASAMAPDLVGTRHYFFHRFPFFVVFPRNATRIEIVAVAHGRPGAGYWIGR
jgi:hypothetical protein